MCGCRAVTPEQARSWSPGLNPSVEVGPGLTLASSKPVQADPAKGSGEMAGGQMAGAKAGMGTSADGFRAPGWTSVSSLATPSYLWLAARSMGLGGNW